MAYFLAETVDEALARLADHPGARVIAGGTDVYPALGEGLPRWDLVDVTRIPDCRGISRSGGGWRLGAAATWSDVLAADLPPAFDGLKAAAREVGSVQIQNTGTVAGNLCNASPAADGVPPLLTLDAEVELAGPEGARRMPLDRFITGVRMTALGPGEIVVALHMPDPGAGTHSSFRKLGSRRYLVISIAMVAVLLQADAGRIAMARVAVGACSPVARRLPALEAALIGLDAGQVAALDLAPFAGALAPITDVRGSAEYREEAAVELLRRAVLDALNGGQG